MTKCWLVAEIDTADDMHPQITNVRVYLSEALARAWKAERDAALERRREYNAAMLARFMELRLPEDIAYQKVALDERQQWWGATVARLNGEARTHADRLFPDLTTEIRTHTDDPSFAVDREYTVEELEMDNAGNDERDALLATVAAFRQALQGMIDQYGDGDTTCMSANEDADEVLASTDAGKDLLLRLEDGWARANEWSERARKAEADLVQRDHPGTQPQATARDTRAQITLRDLDAAARAVDESLPKRYDSAGERVRNDVESRLAVALEASAGILAIVRAAGEGIADPDERVREQLDARAADGIVRALNEPGGHITNDEVLAEAQLLLRSLLERDVPSTVQDAIDTIEAARETLKSWAAVGQRKGSDSE